MLTQKEYEQVVEKLLSMTIEEVRQAVLSCGGRYD